LLSDRRKRHDPYYRRAKKERYAARSIFKLEELDRRYRLLRAGQLVLDLGCRPGSWLQYASERVGAAGRVVGLDREALDLALPANAVVLVGDVLAIDPEQLARPARSGEGPFLGFHVVLSDMAPDTSGVAFTDQVRSVELFLRALELARILGRAGGAFVGKIFMGDGFSEAHREVARRYQAVKTARPDATRKESTELYIVGRGLRAW
jgi:23S rRNA (uridine2552-2'-O)-methyltransferase